ncbi:MAG: class I SAM-dependent methyltransferase [Ancalomicrobiaceae bacterium]|nr:class I SAM-dependent methyltransferase [Ancalomicrobiaceae bacterium]
MTRLVSLIESRIAEASVPLSLGLPSGEWVGPAAAKVKLKLNDHRDLASLALGRVGVIGEGFVEGRVGIEGTMRDAMDVAASMMPSSVVGPPPSIWTRLMLRIGSYLHHTRAKDAAQIQFHYDVSDDFYALWLDPRRVYSCAYYLLPELSLADAQAAKLDLICRKLDLKSGERFLDIGAGWGGLLIWAAENYGVEATGITLSKNQHAHVSRLIEQKGLGNRVRVRLLDYRDLDGQESYDKIASIGMFEHVGEAKMRGYFAKLKSLLEPGKLLMNHGITSSGLDGAQIGSGLGDFIERYIFPGGELLHVSQVLREAAAAGLEMVDVENLRPHYAKTLWAWSDALEAQLPEAEKVLKATAGDERGMKILRAYRLYLAGCAMAFERGWVALHQILATNPSGEMSAGAMRGAQSDYPFKRDYIYS